MPPLESSATTEESATKPLWIGTSWKMNKLGSDARAWANTLTENLTDDVLSQVQPFVIPSFTAISPVAQVLDGRSPVLVGAQNAHWEDYGAWPGELSVPQVKDAGASIVEIGHSERRTHFGETIETTRRKVEATIRCGMRPLLCIGEPADTKAAGQSAEYILEQAHGALDGLDESDLGKVLIAYEPMWAIGDAGRPPRTEELVESFAALGDEYDHRVEALLYGGSVTVDNAAQLLSIDHVGGLFVGRTAWDVHGYLELLRIAEAHRRS
ncbi:MAG: triose-phosphate isomerase [Kocuria sp.]|nr:triose-phosphate isomerase [Kocuria sp.]